MRLLLSTLSATRAVSRKDAIIIVDTIRASTTYVNAFSSGAERIVPCASREDLEHRLSSYPDSVKSGKRQCRKIECDYGSSPLEMSKVNLSGKTMLSSTTNGSHGCGFSQLAMCRYGFFVMQQPLSNI